MASTPSASRRLDVAIGIVIVLAAAQSFLLSEGIGRQPGIRWGIGIPLILALVILVAWRAASRRSATHRSTS